MMPENDNDHADDLKGASQLTIDALTGIAKLVEALHSAILQTVMPGSNSEKAGGITGFVYQTTRFITRSVGSVIDKILSRLQGKVGTIEETAKREAVVAALNGVLGDYLESTHNELAIKMKLRKAGQALSDNDRTQLRSAPRVLLLIHGLCMNDHQWERKGHHHGRKLAEELGFTIVYLYYNTGRHISENGHELDQKLTELFFDSSTVQLYILAHSMGGLVARSACLAAQRNESSWLRKLRKMVFLGTPHQGALLEKSGNWVDKMLDTSPYSAPFSKLGKVRSAGITDMRYGYVKHEDWKGQDRFASDGNNRSPAPLPEKVECYAIATIAAGDLPEPIDRHLVGDGLVTVRSALGKHQKEELDLNIPPSRCWEGKGISHLGLLNSPAVYKQIAQWLGRE